MQQYRLQKSLLSGALVLLIFLSGGSCSLLRQPQKAPPRKSQHPVIQTAEAGKEPVLRVFIDETGEIVEMKMEDYLAGVVAAEMKTDWPLEALAAQAIMARTFTLEAINDKGGSPLHNTDACTSAEHFQAYDAKAINDRVREAIKMSRGEVAFYNNEFIKAWFSAYAGEKTALAKEGLAFAKKEPPYIKSVKNPGAQYAPAEDKAWTATFAKDEIKAALAKMNKNAGAINEVSIARKGPTGRAVVVKIDNIEVSGPDLRIALGSTKLKSILLSKIAVSDNKVIFQGHGYGHGVGMCQWGAYALAKKGTKPKEIVQFFFKDITVNKMWD